MQSLLLRRGAMMRPTLLGLQMATQCTAGAYGYHPHLGAPSLTLGDWRFYAPCEGRGGGVLTASSSQNTGAKQSKQILWLIRPHTAPSVRCQRIVCWHHAHTIVR